MKVLSLQLLLFASFSCCIKVHQPPFAISQEGDPSVTLQCEQNQEEYLCMYWYRCIGSGEMELLTYSLNEGICATEAPFNKSKYTMLRPDVLRSTLHIYHVEAGDSAVYYCISRLPQWLRRTLCLNNNPDSKIGQGLTSISAAITNDTEPNRTVTPPTVKLLGPSKKVCKKKTADISTANDKRRTDKTLVCVASHFYPDHVTVSWQIDGVKVAHGVATDNAALREGDYYSITSRLTVPQTEWFTGGRVFTCYVSFFNGNETVHSYSSIEGVDAPARVKYLKVTNAAKWTYTVLIVKSSVFGAFVVLLVWRLQASPGKTDD